MTAIGVIHSLHPYSRNEDPEGLLQGCENLLQLAMVSFLLGQSLTPAVKMRDGFHSREMCQGLCQEGQDPFGVYVARWWACFPGKEAL